MSKKSELTDETLRMILDKLSSLSQQVQCLQAEVEQLKFQVGA